MKQGIFLAILCTLLVTHISGCATLKIKNQADQLKNSITYYESALKWGRHEQVFHFHLTHDGKKPTLPNDYLKDFDFTHVKTLSTQLLPVSEKSTPEALVHMEVNYFNKAQGKIKEKIFKQTWWYNSEIQGWLIDGDFPKLE